MSRLTIHIDDQQHQNLKAMAKLQGKSIKQYVIERLFHKAVGEDDTWQELKSLLAQRISECLSGGVSTQSINEIVDAELALDFLPSQKVGANEGAGMRG